LTGWGLQPDQLGQYYQRNVTKAKQLLAEAGYPNGFDLELLITPQYGAGIVNASVMLKDQLKDIGLNCEIRQAEYAAYLKEFQGGTFKDIIIAPQGAPIEVDECIYSIFHSQSAKNYVHIKDANLDAMLTKQRQTIDDAERKKQVAAIQNYLNEQLYVIGVFVSSSGVVWQPYLKGFRPHAFGSYAMHMWQDVWLQK
jgi:peptide/nickel transport system substrate-binding protein